jgi:HAD superfamily hydrolase (TIGR01549 family)
MQDARWLFFDLGNTLISEEAATEHRIQQLVSSLERSGTHCSIEDVRSALRKASEEFAPRLITRAIEKLTDNLELRKLIEAEARYPKELEAPYDGAEQTLRALSARWKIGVIANQSAGTEERLRKWGLMPFISICLSSAEVGLEKPDPAIFELALSQAGCTPLRAVMIGDRLDNDIRPARLLGWKTIRMAQGFGRFQSPRDALDEADLAVENVKLLIPALMGGLKT